MENIQSNTSEIIKLDKKFIKDIENLKIEYIGGIKDMNVGKCLKERTKQMNLYIDQFDTKDSNIINLPPCFKILLTSLKNFIG